MPRPAHQPSTNSVTVLGLWHLGTVSAACLSNFASVTAIDPDPENIANLQKGLGPVFEPGLDQLLQKNMQAGRLKFQQSNAQLPKSQYLWVAFDTPIDAQGKGKPEKVLTVLDQVIPRLPCRTCIVLHTQLPVGTTKQLEDKYPQHDFCYIPENLRLGSALREFQQADRYIVGARNENTLRKIRRLLAPLGRPIDRMSPESAELSKHALNSFLATSIVFANEIGTLCPKVGADAREVLSALQSDRRIGPQSYLRPGPAFSGGTLARDVLVLEKISLHSGTGQLLRSITQSNRRHSNWAFAQIKKHIPAKKTILIVGLVYKAGTNTLRGSHALKLIRKLEHAGYHVLCYDPALKESKTNSALHIVDSLQSLKGISACVAINIRHDLPQQAEWNRLYRMPKPPLFFDAGGSFEPCLGSLPVYYNPFLNPAPATQTENTENTTCKTPK